MLKKLVNRVILNETLGVEHESKYLRAQNIQYPQATVTIIPMSETNPSLEI